MKTKEFIEQVKELGYEVIEANDHWHPELICINIMKKLKLKNGRLEGASEYSKVSENIENRLDVHSSSYNLVKLIIEYAETPLAEREDDKKYYVKVFNNYRGYLNFNCNTGDAMTASIEQIVGFKMRFTEAEIEQLKQRNDIPLDWDKVKLIEVDDD